MVVKKLGYYESVSNTGSFVKVFVFANSCNSKFFVSLIQFVYMKSKLSLPSKWSPSSLLYLRYVTRQVRGGGLPCPFSKIVKKCRNLGKKCPDCGHLCVKFLI